MAFLIKNEKQRKLIRLKQYDYSEIGHYFVTICTKSRELYFENNKIKNIAEKCWLEIPRHFKNTRLDTFVIMPNHIHGIIIIEDVKPVRSSFMMTDKTRFDKSNITVGTDYNLSLPKQNKFHNVIPGSLSYIIAGYKSAVTRVIRKNKNLPFFSWQPRFYDHIIGDDESLNNIREYIIENPLKWNLDAENPDNWKYDKKMDLNKYYKNIFHKEEK